MIDQWSAHLRFHYRIDPISWKKLQLTEEQIFEWWCEYLFIKKELGEIKEPEKS